MVGWSYNSVCAPACPGVLIGDPFGKELRNGKTVHIGIIAIQNIDAVNNVVSDLKASNGAIRGRIKANREAEFVVDGLSARHLDVGCILQEDQVGDAFFICLSLELCGGDASNTHCNACSGEGSNDAPPSL
jgi:hypothetical protein